MTFRLVTTVCTGLIVLCLMQGNLHAEVTFDWATVGNPGNAPDKVYTTNNPTNLQFGTVNYTYRISKHEVTNDQYAEFLNTVAASDPNGLFNASMDITRIGSPGSYTYSANAGFDFHPVGWISFLDAMRFVNWLENGQGNGSTELGVYTISDGVSETRAASATFFIPSEDEWYKAAYFDPRLATAGGPPGDDNYWLYPTRSDAPTVEGPPGGDNSANYDIAVGDTTDVGAYVTATGFYGTFDQGGNVCELIEFRVGRGGSWGLDAGSLAASYRFIGNATGEDAWVGFRVASIPEPSTWLLGLLTAVGLLMRKRIA